MCFAFFFFFFSPLVALVFFCLKFFSRFLSSFADHHRLNPRYENAIIKRTRARTRKRARTTNATRNRIREKKSLFRAFTRRSALGLKKTERENTHLSIPLIRLIHFLRGRPFEFVYFNNGALVLFARAREIVFSHTREVASPSFPFAFYGENAFRRTREVFERDLCAQSREACAHYTVTLTRLFIFSRF